MAVLGTVFGSPTDKSGATTESRYSEGAVDDEMTFETEERPPAILTQPTTTSVETPRGVITARFEPRVVSRTPGPAKPGVTQTGAKQAIAKQGVAPTSLPMPIKETATKWLVYAGLAVAVVGVGYLVLKKVGEMAKAGPATAAVDDIDADVPDCGCKN